MAPRYAIVECDCGVLYNRREVSLPIKDIGFFDCVECGKRLEVWYGRNVPSFTRLMSQGERKINRA
jgi:hypothetical protein